MQAIAPVTTAQLLYKGQRPPLLKFEIKYCCCWVDLTPYVIKESLSISTAGAEMTPAPVAGDWSISLFNKNGRFDPDEDAYAPRNEYLRVGRKVRISIGARYGGVDYYWRRIYGFMELPDFSIDKSEVYLNGFDNMQFLADTILRKPDNYWGTIQTFSTVATVNTYGAEGYNEIDAMDINNEANNVANWQTSPAPPQGPGFASVADGAAPGGNWVGEITLGTTPANNRVLDDNILNGNVTAGKQYRVVFQYRNITMGGTVDVNIYESGAGGGIMGGVTCAFSAAYVETSFVFTATITGTIRMTIENFIGGFNLDTWRIDVISVMEITGTSNARYNMIAASQGAYYATLNGVPVWYGVKDEGWYYDYDNHIFYFDDNKQIDVGVDNLIVYYFTVQVPENVVADLLVIAGLYDTQAEALADMIDTATGTTINQVWFDAGTTVTDAIRLICERCNYRFYFNYSGRPVFNLAPAPIATCDVTTDWTASAGGILSIDTGDKKMGAGSLKNTVAAPAGAVWYNTEYDPAGSWNWSAKNYILFWLKSDRASTAFTAVRLTLWDTLGNWRYWNLTFAADTWTAMMKLLSTGDAESVVAPNLALIDNVQISFQATDAVAFYKKIDDIRVTDFTFTESHINNIRDYEDRSEIRNRIVIKGRHQAQFVERRETMPSELDGEASEVASINKYGEHTWEIKNHLFQDQATINIYKAIYLAAFKDPKWYTTFDTPFNPIPLEKSDTGTWRKQYEVGGTPIDQRGIIREIQIDEFIVSYKIEKVA